MFVNYNTVATLAQEKDVDTRRLFVALSQLARMENSEATITSILNGNWSVNEGAITLDDKTDPNRSEIDLLYQRA